MRIPFYKPGPQRPGFLVFLAFITLLLLPLAYSNVHAQQRMLLPTTALKLQQHEILVEVAATEASRNQGLMYRTSLGHNQGMLFVFEESSLSCFWMKNTLIPLSIAFIDEQGKIINIMDMQPHSLDNHCPKASMRYALEMPQGWFHKLGIGSGDAVTGLPAEQ